MNSQDMLIYSGIFFGLLILSCTVIYKLKMSFINPFSVFFLPIFIYLAISFLGIDDAMTPFKPFTWLVLLSSWFTFLAGMAITESFALQKFPSMSNNPNTSQAFHGYRWTGHMVFAITVMGLSCVSNLFTYLEIGSTVLFSGKAGEWVHNGKLYAGPYPLFYFQGGAIIPITLFMIAGVKAWNPNYGLRLFANSACLISFIISFLFLPTKGMLMQAGLFWIALQIMSGYRIKLYQLILAPALAFISFLAIVYFQTGLFLSQIKLPYDYIANNYWNLDYALSHTENGWPQPLTYGFTAANGLLSFLPMWGEILKQLQFDTIYNESICKVKGLNTVSFQWHLFRDFGMFSLVLGSFLLGTFTTWIWKRILHRPNPMHIVLYLTILFSIVQSSFAGQWINPTHMMWILGNTLCAYLFARRSKLPPPVPMSNTHLSQSERAS